MQDHGYGKYFVNRAYMDGMSNTLSNETKHIIRIRMPDPDFEQIDVDAYTKPECQKLVQAVTNLHELKAILSREASAAIYDIHKNHWEGVLPVTSSYEQDASLLNRLNNLCHTVNLYAYLRLAAGCNKYFDMWWDPEKFPQRLLNLLSVYCKEHEPVWGGYLAAYVLQHADDPDKFAYASNRKWPERSNTSKLGSYYVTYMEQRSSVNA